ncbi:MAG: hypothetical protein ABIH41_00845 [Nanoarchaeota archaeon]
MELDIKDRTFLRYLRRNARENLTTISRKTHIPISTLYDRLKAGESAFMLRHTTLVDFTKLGYHCRVSVTVKVPRDQRDQIGRFLSTNENVNTVYKINNGFDYLFEGIFRHVKDHEDFMEHMESKFKIVSKQIHYIIEDVVREHFLAGDQPIDMMG